MPSGVGMAPLRSSLVNNNFFTGQNEREETTQDTIVTKSAAYASYEINYVTYITATYTRAKRRGHGATKTSPTITAGLPPVRGPGERLTKYIMGRIPFGRWAEALILLISLNLVAGWWVGTPSFTNHHGFRAKVQKCAAVRSFQTSTSGLLSLRCQQSSLYEDQEKVIVERGRLEGQIMTGSQPLAANIPKKAGAGSGGGFGAGKKSKKVIAEELKIVAKSHAAVLKKEGVVRIDNVLSDETADRLRSWALDLRVRALEEVIYLIPCRCATCVMFMSTFIAVYTCTKDTPAFACQNHYGEHPRII